MNINPVLEKDLKTKLRGWRSSILICCYVLLLTGILFLYFAGNNLLSSYNNTTFNPRVAVNAYNLLITFQFALLFLAVPAITATAISSERERQTLDLMLVTRTPAIKIVLGKIMVSLAHTMLLLLASMPVIGVVFFFGGIGLIDIVKLILFYVMTAFFVACCGVFFSTLFKRNIVAIITTYIFLGLVTFGPFLVLIIRVYYQEITNVAFSLEYQNFVTTLFSSSVFGFFSFYFTGGNSGGMLMSITQEIESLRAVAPGVWKHLHPWLVNGVFNITSSVLLIFASSAILNPVRRTK